MTDIAIRVDNLSTLYPEPAARAGHLGAVHQRPDTTSMVLCAAPLRGSTSLGDALTAPFRRKHDRTTARPHASSDDLWALKDVSFEVKRGEVVDTRVRAVEATLASRFSPRHN